MSNRPPKRLFQPVKRVAFHESLVQMIPTPILSDSEASTEENSPEDPSLGERIKDVNAKPAEKLDGMPGRRKRRGRDWIWRPVNDEASPTHADEHSTTVVVCPPMQDSTPVDSKAAVALSEVKEPQEPPQ